VELSGFLQTNTAAAIRCDDRSDDHLRKYRVIQLEKTIPFIPYREDRPGKSQDRFFFAFLCSTSPPMASSMRSGWVLPPILMAIPDTQMGRIGYCQMSRYVLESLSRLLVEGFSKFTGELKMDLDKDG
jgi:hypothetical protein